MCNPLAVGAVMAIGSAVSAFSGAEASRAQARQQADMMNYEAAVSANNAVAMRQQKDIELQKGQIEQNRVDEERNRLRRAYEAEAGTNRSLLAGQGVDISSGSAADSLLGNSLLFAEDMGVNRYNFQLAGWEAREAGRQAETQARQFDHEALVSRQQASWIKKTSGNLGTSLLTAGLAGGKGFFSGYSLAGGNFFKGD